MELIDLSAPIVPEGDDIPEILRTNIEFVDHAAGAMQIADIYGVGSELLRRGEGWAIDTFTRFGTHNSTHVDAPFHYNSTIDGRPAQTIDQLPLHWFFRPGVVLDFRDRADGQAIEPNDVDAALRAVGHELSKLDIVLMRTGRDAYYGDTDYPSRGPGVSAEATRWLYDKGVRVMGIDAWGWDQPLPMQAQAALASGKPGVFWAAHQAELAYSQIERLVNLHLLPATGFTVACFPLRITGGSAAPARVVAILDSDGPG